MFKEQDNQNVEMNRDPTNLKWYNDNFTLLGQLPYYTSYDGGGTTNLYYKIRYKNKDNNYHM